MALNMASVRDTKWLTLEVCRQFQRGNCSRSDEECKFAHPPKSCQVENGRVIACFDSLKVSKSIDSFIIFTKSYSCEKKNASYHYVSSCVNGFSIMSFLSCGSKVKLHVLYIIILHPFAYSWKFS